MSYTAAPNPKIKERLEVHTALEHYVGTYQFMTLQMRLFWLAQMTLNCGLLLWHVRQRWFAPKIVEDMTFVQVISTFSVERICGLVALIVFASLAAYVVILRVSRRNVTLSLDGLSFDGKAVAYRPEEILSVRRIGRRGVATGIEREDLEFVLGWPRTGLGRIIPWRREAFRIRLPHERKRG